MFVSLSQRKGHKHKLSNCCKFLTSSSKLFSKNNLFLELFENSKFHTNDNHFFHPKLLHIRTEELLAGHMLHLSPGILLLSSDGRTSVCCQRSVNDIKRPSFILGKRGCCYLIYLRNSRRHFSGGFNLGVPSVFFSRGAGSNDAKSLLLWARA
ncbi:hypothetical protein CEXT_136521 [Caerostris extrusa]|uniref:Uncharacterized protein n=1 Tax=Caerostris extrusa TaxID=172846 RepID=A0AAV4U282_CAEEX|nr:hypothetical protein CEXT_136521 [Caerostris extrusa]